jgi:hypothetical protein
MYADAVFRPEWVSATSMTTSPQRGQIVKVDGIQERLYSMRVQVTINDGRWRPIFEYPAAKMITDSPAVLNRIKHLSRKPNCP